jgi:hypothetical protein
LKNYVVLKNFIKKKPTILFFFFKEIVQQTHKSIAIFAMLFYKIFEISYGNELALESDIYIFGSNPIKVNDPHQVVEKHFVSQALVWRLCGQNNE